MFLRRSAVALSRRAAAPVIRAHPTRTFATSIARREAQPPHEGTPEQKAGQPSEQGKMIQFQEVKTMDDLLPPGAEPGTVPTDENQSTGLERLEILGKMQGIDVFDMSPLDASRKGTLDNPILVNSAGDEQFAGCTGYPADSHWTVWLRMDRAQPVERCTECGSVYRMEYIGPPDDEHGHGHGHHHGPGEPEYDFYRDGLPDLAAETSAPDWGDLVKPEYRYR